MKIVIGVSLSMCLIVCATLPSYAKEEFSAYVHEAREATMTFQKALKKELMSAMQSGGLQNAVEVCHSRAPEIAEGISQQTGWQIGRTSLKTRNANNVPNALERDVLKQFEQRKADGEPVNKLEWWQETEEAIAYMKAIPMQGMCASCHGKYVSPELTEHIAQFYPHDMATGFAVGDIRGAFSLTNNRVGVNGKAAE